MIGGQIEVKDAKPAEEFLRGRLCCQVAGPGARSRCVGMSSTSPVKTKFFNLIIEGVNMLASERAEIGALAGSSRAATSTG